MAKSHTLLFLGAHPDDESFGPGGALAEYALRGYRVIYGCATRGEVGSADPEHLQGYASPGDMRWAEVTAAVKELGIELEHLGYHDSGMTGSKDNENPIAFINQPLEIVVQRSVQMIRHYKPEVVFTFDPIGGYRHPDHIHIHNATVKAFHLAGDAMYHPELGAAYQPQKLYFHVFPKGLLKLAVRIMPLFGQNPRKFGRNKDIDIASLAEVEFPVHAEVPVSEAAALRKESASACHKSQLPGGPGRNTLAGRFMRLFGGKETFMRAHPPVVGKLKEKDLFEGIV